MKLSEFYDQYCTVDGEKPVKRDVNTSFLDMVEEMIRKGHPVPYLGMGMGRAFNAAILDAYKRCLVKNNEINPND